MSARSTPEKSLNGISTEIHCSFVVTSRALAVSAGPVLIKKKLSAVESAVQ